MRGALQRTELGAAPALGTPASSRVGSGVRPRVRVDDGPITVRSLGLPPRARAVLAEALGPQSDVVEPVVWDSDGDSPVDAVFLAHGNAREVLEAARAWQFDPRGADIPLVVALDSSDLGARLDAFALGVDDCVEPTVAPAELAARIARVVRARRELRALEALSWTCPLTGLGNRRRFDRDVRAELSRATREGSPLSLVVVDLDHFKGVNDRFTHVGGDAALRAVGNVLARGIRLSDHASRLGGEEFAVLLPNTTTAGALILADRLRLAIAELEVEAPAGPLRLTASLGLATSFPWEGAAAHNALLLRADEALYRAKTAGRDRTVAWTSKPDGPTSA